MINDSEYNDVIKIYNEVIKSDEAIKRDRGVKGQSILSKILLHIVAGIFTVIGVILAFAILIGVSIGCGAIVFKISAAFDPYPDRHNITLKYNDGICPVDNKPWALVDESDYKNKRIYSCGEHFVTVQNPSTDEYDIERHTAILELNSDKPEKEN